MDVTPEEAEGILVGLRRGAPKVLVQVLASRRPPDLAALEMVAAQTIAASTSGETLAKKPELDLLLRISGTRQIGEAIERHGYKSGKGTLYLIAASADPKAMEGFAKLVGTDLRLRELPRRTAGKTTLERVERAALLSCGL